MNSAAITEILRKPLVVIDAGGRGGFSLLPGLNPHIQLYSFEPDKASFGRLKEIIAQSGFRSAEVFPIALSDSNSTAQFFRTAHPSMSSLLSPDQDRFHASYNAVRHHEEWASKMNVVEKTEVETQTLASFLETKNIDAIDLLKLDTQGAELKILQGAEKLLREKRIGMIFAEVLFIPTYKGHPVFSEIDTFLRDCGYRFIDLRIYPEVLDKENSLSFSDELMESPKYCAGGDAVYIPEFSVNDDPAEIKRVVLLLANLGYYSDSKHLLTTFCGMKENEAGLFLRNSVHNNRRKGFKRFLQRWTPPAIANLYTRMKK